MTDQELLDVIKTVWVSALVSEIRRLRDALNEAADLAHSMGDDGFIPSAVAQAIRDLATRSRGGDRA